jgi:hypothetical protein
LTPALKTKIAGNGNRSDRDRHDNRAARTQRARMFDVLRQGPVPEHGSDQALCAPVPRGDVKALDVA